MLSLENQLFVTSLGGPTHQTPVLETQPQYLLHVTRGAGKASAIVTSLGASMSSTATSISLMAE